ncbi:glycoside hydrolase family 88 protein [Kineothrix sp. MB12-C1]|uniref:glycoside hydrolase family 88 protein n=1 Tax=Kineothrix sp. MB12-C1 TaxID=3070215 RepID=UPI0027D294C7|nr:glycoside hydrolase family 88 protein [Kineothrix sp. MB12-C1]WMC94140.1 glycoside hydrolase family 88 protein [Kineothrix sp. MB12-C1]
MLYENMPMITDREVNEALRFCAEQIIRNLPEFTYKFQNAYSENNFYKPIENNDWTTGFWTGEIWLAYEYCGDERLKRVGEIQIESFLHRIDEKIVVDHHDMGFLYSPSCVAGYKLIGSKAGREAAIKAADQLISRYHPVGEFIQAWGAMDAPENYRLIIDCLLNLPLLYWASEETGDNKYRNIAEKHIHTTIKNIIREDYSTWHTFFFDMKTGAPDHGATCQGYRDGSAWARGQAWGIYGSALAYKYTGRKEYMNIFKNVTGYFLEHLPKDMVPFWDLEFTDGDDQPRDSSSASIAACGMLEMIKYMEKEDAAIYKKYAMKLMKSLYDNYAVKDERVSNGLVLHSTYSNHSPYNTCHHCGVDECNSWGDYFYMEALTRLQKDWVLYW